MRNKFISIAMAAALATGLAACSDDTTGNGDADGDKLRVAIIAKSNAGEFWLNAKAGAMAAGEEFGVDVSYNGPDTENEGEKQLNQLQAAVNEEPDGLGFAPQNGAEEGSPRILDEAVANGTNVAAFATPITFSDAPMATIASNNVAMGEMAAENLIELIGDSGEIAIITNGMVGDAAIRRDSFVEYLAENAPGIEVVSVQDGMADRAISSDKAQAILQAHPDLKAIYGTSDHPTIAAADTVRNMGRDVKVVGIDATPDLITLVEEGAVAGIVTQNAYDVGYQTVKVLADAANGTMPDNEYVEIPSVWATADNLEDPAVKQALGL